MIIVNCNMGRINKYGKYVFQFSNYFCRCYCVWWKDWLQHISKYSGTKRALTQHLNYITVSNNAATRYLALYSRLQQRISVHLTEKVLLNLQLMFPMVILEFVISVMVDIYLQLVTYHARQCLICNECLYITTHAWSPDFVVQ